MLNVPGGECTVGRSTGPIDDVTRRQYDFFVWRLQGAGIPYWNDPKENAR
ncbi:hypothetical protein [Pseudoxanthomonas sp.]|nr:hypothetical protein [Pseudoxanthomonas sp.]WDS38241.1 MAG: hypothetical protein O8I58_19050 [Pseudoxanthomonas sp.]